MRITLKKMLLILLLFPFVTSAQESKLVGSGQSETSRIGALAMALHDLSIQNGKSVDTDSKEIKVFDDNNSDGTGTPSDNILEITKELDKGTFCGVTIVGMIKKTSSEDDNVRTKAIKLLYKENETKRFMIKYYVETKTMQEKLVINEAADVVSQEFSIKEIYSHISNACVVNEVFRDGQFTISISVK